MFAFNMDTVVIGPSTSRTSVQLENSWDDIDYIVPLSVCCRMSVDEDGEAEAKHLHHTLPPVDHCHRKDLPRGLAWWEVSPGSRSPETFYSILHSLCGNSGFPKIGQVKAWFGLDWTLETTDDIKSELCLKPDVRKTNIYGAAQRYDTFCLVKAGVINKINDGCIQFRWAWPRTLVLCTLTHSIIDVWFHLCLSCFDRSVSCHENVLLEQTSHFSSCTTTALFFSPNI